MSPCFHFSATRRVPTATGQKSMVTMLATKIFSLKAERDGESLLELEVSLGLRICQIPIQAERIQVNAKRNVHVHRNKGGEDKGPFAGSVSKASERWESMAQVSVHCPLCLKGKKSIIFLHVNLKMSQK